MYLQLLIVFKMYKSGHYWYKFTQFTPIDPPQEDVRTPPCASEGHKSAGRSTAAVPLATSYSHTALG